jgi:hypothetical protein
MASNGTDTENAIRNTILLAHNPAANERGERQDLAVLQWVALVSERFGISQDHAMTVYAGLFNDRLLQTGNALGFSALTDKGAAHVMKLRGAKK